MSLEARCWSPAPGTQLLAIEHERAGDERPAIWDIATGEREDLELDTEGPVFVSDWWPDGSALLLVNRRDGRDRLLRYDVSTGEQQVLFDHSGLIWKARVRPDGRVWLLHELGHRRRRVVDDSGSEVLALQGDDAPAGQPYQSWRFTNPHGQSVHGFYVTPEGSGGRSRS